MLLPAIQRSTLPAPSSAMSCKACSPSISEGLQRVDEQFVPCLYILTCQQNLPHISPLPAHQSHRQQARRDDQQHSDGGV